MDTFARVLRVSRETSSTRIDLDKSASKTALLISDSRPQVYNGGRGRYPSRGRERGYASNGRGNITNVRNGGRGSQPTVLGPCYHCGEYGHVQHFCRHLSATPKVANIAESGLQQSVTSSDSALTLSPTDYAAFTQFQISQQSSPSTAGLIQTGNASACLTTSLPSVIDSGASDYMTGTSSNLSNFQPMSYVPCVTLANGSKTIVKGTGTATLSASLSLPSTLYMPDFSFNLLSVSTLTKSYNCSITFSPTLVSFRISRRRRRLVEAMFLEVYMCLMSLVPYL